MKIFSHGFWGGFIEKTDPNNIDFFLKLFSIVFNTECTIGTLNDSDILLESVFSSSTYLMAKPWKYTFCFSGESTQRAGLFCSPERLKMLSSYSCVLTGERNHNNVVNTPLFVSYVYCNNMVDLLNTPPPRTAIPPKDICVIVSNSEATDRNHFFDILDRHFTVDYAGKYKNNVPRITADYNTKEFREFVSQYKFIISMDNSKDDTYITEKIIHGFVSGIIPVYWGSDFVCDYFNEARFINVPNMSNETIGRTIDYMKFLLDNPDEWIKKVNQPVFPDAKGRRPNTSGTGTLSRTIRDIAKDVQNTIFKRELSPMIEQSYVITSELYEPDRYNHILDVFFKTLQQKPYNMTFHCPTYKTDIAKVSHPPADGSGWDTTTSRRCAENSLFYNHISVLHDIKKRYKGGYFLICESDVMPTENMRYFHELMKLLDKNREKWDIISIGSPYSYMMFQDYWAEDFTKEGDAIRLIKKRKTRCTDSFVYSYSGVIKFLSIVEKNMDFTLPIDHYTNKILEKYPDELRMYWSIPSFFDQGSFHGMRTKMD